MQVVILAGGKGTRLAPLTHDIPKPMVSVRGRPFLEHLIELFKCFSFTDVLILACYLGEQIEDYFGDGDSFDVRIRYSYEKLPLGTGGALKNANSMLDEAFLLVNGDTFLPIDYHVLVSRFKQLCKSAMIVAYNGLEPIAVNNLKIEHGSIVAYNKDNPDGMTHLDAGVIAMKKEVLKLIESGCVCSLEKQIFPKLIADGQLAAFETQQKFYDMGTFRGLDVIQGVLK